MNQERKSGILLHPTSLPGKYGIGTLGKEAFAFIDFLIRSGQSLWQVCPLGPTGYGDSPYQCFSAFAGNPLLIDLEVFVQKNFLTIEDIEPANFSEESIDYGRVIQWKTARITKNVTVITIHIDKRERATLFNTYNNVFEFK